MDIKFLQNESGAKIKGASGDFVAVDMDNIKSFSGVVSHAYSGSDSGYPSFTTDTVSIVPLTSTHSFELKGYRASPQYVYRWDAVAFIFIVDLVIQSSSLKWRCHLETWVKLDGVVTQDSDHYDYLPYSTGSLTFENFDNMAGYDTTVSSVVLT